MHNLAVCLVSCPDRAVATSLARTMVQNRLAACVSICPGIESIYLWQGELCSTKELLLLIKTTTDQVEPIKAFLRSEHPYEVPELLVVPPTAVLEEYAEWVTTSTKQ